MMRLMLLAVSLALAPVSAAAQCAPPEAAVRRLKSTVAYENGFGLNRAVRQPFSVLKIGDRVYFRHNNPPPHYDPRSRPVYVYGPGRGFDALNCPAGPTWVNCVAEWAQNPGKDAGIVVYGNEPAPTYTRGVPKERPCEFTLDVPVWLPSPDSELKKKVAGEILHEILAYRRVSGTKAVYVRDFNVEDPEVEVYVIDTTGESEVLGCSFEAAKSPHCAWHLFGQAPVASLRRQIMSRPYRLYPPALKRP